MIRLNFISLKNIWNNNSRRNICEAFKEVVREVNNPPLFIEKNRGMNLNASFRNINVPGKLGRAVSGKLSEEVMNEIEGEIFVLQEKVDKV